MNVIGALLLLTLADINGKTNPVSEITPQEQVQEQMRDEELIGKHAPELSPGTWINSEPLKLSELRGKVVLLEFWTYGCYNCRNTIPAMNRWQQEFQGTDLVMIGVHTPEFESEKNLANVRTQTAKLGIRYPVVTDNEYRTWEAYNQHYWPVIYLIDKKGIIRYVHIGEGQYDETRRTIRLFLSEQ